MEQENTEAQSSDQMQSTQNMGGQSAQASAADDVSDHKIFAILGYIIPILFFIPLLQDSSKNNAFAKFHANQQLILLICWLGVYVIGRVLLMVFFGLMYLLMPLLQLVLLVVAIIGIVNAAQGTMKELPVIGKYRILK